LRFIKFRMTLYYKVTCDIGQRCKSLFEVGGAICEKVAISSFSWGACAIVSPLTNSWRGYSPGSPRDFHPSPWVKQKNNSHIKFRAVSDIFPGRFGHSSPPLDVNVAITDFQQTVIACSIIMLSFPCPIAILPDIRLHINL